MWRKQVARSRVAVLFGLFLLAACGSPPLTPEEQRAMELESYCRGQAEDEASKHMAQKEQSEVDNVGESDQGWEDATAGSDQASKSEAAFAECMRKNAPE
jgi:hypothetical protein